MDLNIPALISEERSLGVFLLVTVFLGGGAAWLTGRAIAATWRPCWQAVVYALLLGGAVRFLHFALFEATFLSPYFFAVDAAVCLLCALVALRVTHARMMRAQYDWIAGPAGGAPMPSALSSHGRDSG